MTSTIFLSICRFISICASVLFCKQSFKTVVKIYPLSRTTGIRPCRHVGCPYPLTLDYKLEGHNLFHQRTTITNSRLSFQSKNDKLLRFRYLLHSFQTSTACLRLQQQILSQKPTRNYLALLRNSSVYH